MMLITKQYPNYFEISLNRPEKANALNLDLIQQFLTALGTANNPQTNLLILRAEGKHFCAGADLHWMKQGKDSELLAELFYQLYHFPKPTLASVHGKIYGGGVGLTACCDVVLAANSTRFCLSETKLGLTPSVISPYVSQAIGPRWTKVHTLSAQPFSAHTALNQGLVHQVMIEDKLAQATDEFRDSLLFNGPEAMMSAKKLLSEISLRPINTELKHYTAEHIAKITQTAEAQRLLGERAP